jgi:drug/metabolite transporter (DMT)-like permease
MTDRPSLLALVFIFLTVGFTVLGQILVKRGMLEVGKSPSDLATMPEFALRALTSLREVLGLSCAVAAALAWIIAISPSELSFAYPFMALTVVLALVLSGVFLKEEIPMNRWIGVAVYCLGILVASR